MTYYDLLQVPHDATSSQIRKQYYLMAMKYHPDKNPDDPEAEAKFKKVSEAYQILSDPKLRSRYDTLGAQELSPEGGFMNPEDVFRSLFGGEKFVTIIGEISLGRLLAELMVENAAANGASTTGGTGAGAGPSTSQASSAANRPYLTKEKQEEMRRIHDARVETLIANLVQKTNYYTENVYSEVQFREYITKEALDLSKESFGVPLLHSIGYVYSSKAKQRLGKESFLGLSGFMSNLKEKGHIVASLVDTIGAVREVAHDANVEERKEAQRRKVAGQGPTSTSGPASSVSGETSDTASTSAVSEEKMKRALWKASSFEVEATLREVCERFLSIKQRDLALKRAVALKMIGDIYRSMKE